VQPAKPGTYADLYGRNARWAYSHHIGNLVQHLSEASMATLPHLRKSFANGLNSLTEIRPLLVTDACILAARVTSFGESGPKADG
jgi:hypothetical protein